MVAAVVAAMALGGVVVPTDTMAAAEHAGRGNPGAGAGRTAGSRVASPARVGRAAAMNPTTASP